MDIKTQKIEVWNLRENQNLDDYTLEHASNLYNPRFIRE